MLIFICFCAFISHFTAQENIDYAFCKYGHNFLYLYICAFAGIGGVWGISYLFKKVFYLSYIGRYSIIVLGTHMVLKSLFMDIFNIENKYIILLIILLLNPIIIYLFKTYLPYVTAQKDLIKYDKGKIVFCFNKIKTKD